LSGPAPKRGCDISLGNKEQSVSNSMSICIQQRLLHPLKLSSHSWAPFVRVTRVHPPRPKVLCPLRRGRVQSSQLHNSARTFPSCHRFTRRAPSTMMGRSLLPLNLSFVMQTEPIPQRRFHVWILPQTRLLLMSAMATLPHALENAMEAIRKFIYGHYCRALKVFVACLG
jgi:hypothetical protein